MHQEFQGFQTCPFVPSANYSAARAACRYLLCSEPGPGAFLDYGHDAGSSGRRTRALAGRAGRKYTSHGHQRVGRRAQCAVGFGGASAMRSVVDEDVTKVRVALLLPNSLGQTDPRGTIERSILLALHFHDISFDRAPIPLRRISMPVLSAAAVAVISNC